MRRKSKCLALLSPDHAGRLVAQADNGIERDRAVAVWGFPPRPTLPYWASVSATSRATWARRRAVACQPRSATAASSAASRASASAMRCDFMSPLVPPPPTASGAAAGGRAWLVMPDTNTLQAIMMYHNLPYSCAGAQARAHARARGAAGAQARTRARARGGAGPGAQAQVCFLCLTVAESTMRQPRASRLC